ncbi:radical SAM protein [candidate division KD3-62 bacterium DG_56]|uniref:Radical SAM protein n=1 Tax=candidate division KD3-62 bacterium DG_56 TaxID=1704032 RepID=A0A0S7XMZ4_9BACT|nr:MAG: radical SAM protein [candidate division KD3-62 bacterium DG_56]
MTDFRAAYLDLAASGELAERARQARAMLGECRLCPHNCAVDRLHGEQGRCRTGDRPVVSSHGPHFGEESPLVGGGGSGTIFLTNCNLRCIFCQNADISQYGEGRVVSTEALTSMMLDLQKRGCHNINFVTPTHQAPMILEALVAAAEGGLRLPLVHNCGGYEALPALRLLDGVFDIYMPDCKYADNGAAKRLSGAPDYWERNQEALREMHRQVGDLVLDERGIAQRGLLVRHLVLPNGLAGTEQVVEFLASLSKNTYLNVMAQYRPCNKAFEYEEVARPPTIEEYDRAVRLALDAGLTRLDERPRRLFR